ncbi:MAG: hypothetical protein B7733_13050 [Myxococcales bacterium FL481]|nr:MAG: hypothetical protein B7733_13050 [Myxococcales bacterium FL481]
MDRRGFIKAIGLGFAAAPSAAKAAVAKTPVPVISDDPVEELEGIPVGSRLDCVVVSGPTIYDDQKGLFVSVRL